MWSYCDAILVQLTKQDRVPCDCEGWCQRYQVVIGSLPYQSIGSGTAHPLGALTSSSTILEFVLQRSWRKKFPQIVMNYPLNSILFPQNLIIYLQSHNIPTKNNLFVIKCHNLDCCAFLIKSSNLPEFREGDLTLIWQCQDLESVSLCDPALRKTPFPSICDTGAACIQNDGMGNWGYEKKLLLPFNNLIILLLKRTQNLIPIV